METINKAPLVSVLVPAYNHEKYIFYAVESIVNQTYKNIELLIIDDGSTDHTVNIVKELQLLYKSRFVRFFFQSQENQGTVSTLNSLLKLSRGEYIYIIASDDISKPNSLELLVEFLEKKQDYALVVGDNEIIDSEGKIIYWDNEKNSVNHKKDAKYTTFASILNCKELGSNFGNYCYLRKGNHIPNGYLIRKSILEKTGNYNKNAPLEDWYMHLQISKYAKMKYVDKILFSYRWHANNTVKNTDYMKEITNLTLEQEKKIIRTKPLNSFSHDIRIFLKYGNITKKIKIIPRIIYLITFISENKKTKVLQIFNLLIPIKFKYIKSK